ncbi:DNA-binding transcriptional MerR regulator [Bacillus alveayuensis]|uniref:DNA-binding transcriptional MerR regulator n=1 Tax=Aeribacillus alveayuensis TaxID=279215 RepID=A0ABT9VS28_9BACI|nr:DNA-binding transcriptional MerR regulator [Bacillus alveayuensis]
MEYTVNQLAKLAGVTGRTLRYYDEIGILKPARINSSGYRIYGQKEVDKLQQILFYRELDVDLETIKKLSTHHPLTASRH